MKKIRLAGIFERDLKRNLKNREFREGYEREYTLVRLAFELSKLRENRHLSQAQLAAKVGMKQQVISRVESGNQNTTLETLIRIANGLGKKVEVRIV